MNLYRLARRAAGRSLRAFPRTRRMIENSCDYKVITLEEARNIPGSGWNASATVLRQDRAYDQLLREMRHGKPRADLKIAAMAVDMVDIASPALLEIGCGSGYYAEVFSNLCRSQVRYTGLDYSKAMVAHAQKRYPGTHFVTGDATDLEAAKDSYDIVFNGVSLMHILDFDRAIAESARVARRAVILHSVPILEAHDTVFLRKYAYGAPVAEVVFNRNFLLSMLARHGLHVEQSWHSDDYDIAHVVGEHSHAETFLCRVT